MDADTQAIIKMVAKVDLSSPEKLADFEIWKLEDGSVSGLENLLARQASHTVSVAGTSGRLPITKQKMG
jgi:hypothetical protein